MNIFEAQAIIQSKLDKLSNFTDEFVIQESYTIETTWGWAFFYNSKSYIETGDPVYLIAGNSPFLINKKSGEIKETGTAHPIEYYIKEYEQTLDT